MLDFEGRIKALEDKLSNIIRTGIVSSVNQDGTVRVAFKERGNLLSYDLQVLVRSTLEDKDWDMPDIDEPVLCIFLPIGLEAGFVIGSYYSKKVKPPENRENKRLVQFKDGTRIEYDRESHKITIDVPGDGGEVYVKSASKTVVDSPKIDLGSSGLEPSVLGDKLAAAFSALQDLINGHTHSNGNNGSPTGDVIVPIDFGELLSDGNVYSKKNRNQ